MHITLHFAFIKILFILVESTMKPYIVDGEDAQITSYPHSLHLGVHCKSSKRRSSGKWICGASIVTHEVGLTAAHCLSGCSEYTEITISAGNIKPLEGVVTSASNFTIHPDFIETNGDRADIALVKFKKPLQFSSNIKRVALMQNLTIPKEGYVAGWGIIQEKPGIVKADRLKELKQYLLPREKCIELLHKLPKGVICGRNDKPYAANGDSGSALIVKGYIEIGFVVYRLEFFPKITVYTDVRYYYNWIKTQLHTMMCS